MRSGLLDRVKKSLEAENIAYVELGGVMPNPRSGLVYQGIDICKKEDIDFILAVGGGSTIDSAKAIAAGACYDGDFWDYYMGKPVEVALPIGTVLTIAAAGSEGSPDSVITKEEGMFKLKTGDYEAYPAVLTSAWLNSKGEKAQILATYRSKEETCEIDLSGTLGADLINSKGEIIKTFNGEKVTLNLSANSVFLLKFK